jgi:hypothetical protein
MSRKISKLRWLHHALLRDFFWKERATLASGSPHTAALRRASAYSTLAYGYGRLRAYETAIGFLHVPDVGLRHGGHGKLERAGCSTCNSHQF